jgi:hypothetical protein
MNKRLELAFLVPADRKLTVEVVQATVAEAINAISKEMVKDMQKNNVMFDSLQDLLDYDNELKALKHDWNKRFLARQKEGKK